MTKLKELKLKSVLELMKYLNDTGKSVYFEGVGNGDVKLILEYLEVKNEKDKS